MLDAGNEEINSTLARLARNPDVLGLLVFGSRATGQHGPDSDVDVLVVLPTRSPALEVLHPVIPALGVRFDVWLRSSSEIAALLPEPESRLREESPFVVTALATGHIIKDTESLLSRARQSLARRGQGSKLNPNFTRFRLSHGAESLARLASGDDLCFDVMYSLEVASCLIEYGRITDLPHRSIRELLEYVRENESSLHALIKAGHTERVKRRKVGYLSEIADHVLRPLGGLVGEEEFIATGTADLPPDVQTAEGKVLWEQLVG